MSTNKTFTIEYRGCRLAYNVRGDGPSVLFIQGVGVHGDGWLPQVDELASRYRCMTFDNRGMNRSQPIGVALSVEQMAEDALKLMNAQGWESAHVVGHSLGGLMAQHLALFARKRLRSLALLCTFARGRDATRPSPWMIWTGLRTRIGTRRQRRHAFLKLVLPPETLAKSDREALAEKLAPIFGHNLADQPPVAMKQSAAMGRYDATSRLGELSGLPTLVVSALHEPPGSSAGVSPALPNLRARRPRHYSAAQVHGPNAR